MALIKRGFILYDDKTGRCFVDKSETTSVIVNSLLLSKITEASAYAGGMLLDVGCGLKPYKELFRRRVTRHVGVDWPNTLHKTRELDAYSTNLALPFRDGSFDTVLCTEVLEHSSEPMTAVREMSRVLKPGGHLIVTAPFFYWQHEEPWDYFRFTSYAFEDMAKKAGVEVVYIKPVGGPFMVIADISSKLMLQYFPRGVTVFFQRGFLWSAAVAESSVRRLGFWRVVQVQRSMRRPISLGHIMVGRKT